jgi:hypothetical protein
MTTVILVAGNDAVSLRDRISALLAGDGMSVVLGPCPLPALWETSMVLCLLSAGMLADPALVAFIENADRQRLPIVPVAEELTTYDFSSVSVRALSSRNAVAWRPGDGQAILQTVRGYLGQEAFPEKKKVFISYRRQDGQPLAEKIYADLWRNHYEAFLDLYQIEPGATVQDKIFARLSDMDFVLFLDTPLARSSRWVQAEIVEALSRRIQVRVISFGQETRYPLLGEVEHLPWEESDPHMLDRLRALVSRGIGSTASFDERVKRVISAALTTKGLRLQERSRRQIVLARRGQRLLVEYEPARPSIERLHRLYQGYLSAQRPPALLVSGEETIHEVTQTAVAWARGRAPLEVVPLIELYSALDRHFPGV